MSKATVFVRDATGLVRGITALDALIINTAILNTLIPFVWGPTLTAYLFPGVDLGQAYFVGFVVSIPIAMVYIQMSTAMPRSGGDYTWVTRSLHPAIGFANNWALTIGVIIYGAFVMNAYTLSQFFLSSQLGVLGVLTGNIGLTQWGTLLGTPIVSLEICTVILAVSAVISALGLKWVRRTWTVYFILMMVGTVIVMGLLAMTPPATFASKFDSYSSVLGTTYSGLILTAGKAGWASQYNPMAAISAVPMTLMMYGGFTFAVYLGGEIKRADRNIFGSIILCLLLGVIVFAGGFALVGYSFGGDFVSALSYLTFAQPQANPLTVPGTVFALLSILLVDNPFLYWLLFIAAIASYLVFILSYYQIISRIFFAWAFDRIAPLALADVNERFHAPIKSIIFTFVLAEIFALMWVFIPIGLQMLNVTLLLVIAFAIMGLSAAVFPYRRKAMYEASPDIVKLEVGGIPVVSICGVITFVFMLVAFVYSYLTPSFSGPTSPTALTATGGLFIGGLVIFYAVKAFRSRMGIDMSVLFKEIPPE
jgi:APA family basic amino acid/polyamine antiporter